MSQKTYIPSGEMPPSSQIGATFEALAATIAARREAGERATPIVCSPALPTGC